MASKKSKSKKKVSFMMDATGFNFSPKEKSVLSQNDDDKVL